MDRTDMLMFSLCLLGLSSPFAISENLAKREVTSSFLASFQAFQERQRGCVYEEERYMHTRYCQRLKGSRDRSHSHSGINKTRPIRDCHRHQAVEDHTRAGLGDIPSPMAR